MYCTACDQECRAEEIDLGIGAYEYWGAAGFHSDIHILSGCCEAEMSEVPPNMTEPDPNLIPAASVDTSPAVGDRVRARGAQGGMVDGPITEVTTEGGRVEFMVDLGDIELGFTRDEIEVVR